MKEVSIGLCYNIITPPLCGCSFLHWYKLIIGAVLLWKDTGTTLNVWPVFATLFTKPCDMVWHRNPRYTKRRDNEVDNHRTNCPGIAFVRSSCLPSAVQQDILVRGTDLSGDSPMSEELVLYVYSVGHSCPTTKPSGDSFGATLHKISKSYLTTVSSVQPIKLLAYRQNILFW